MHELLKKRNITVAIGYSSYLTNVIGLQLKGGGRARRAMRSNMLRWSLSVADRNLQRHRKVKVSDENVSNENSFSQCGMYARAFATKWIFI